MKFVDIEMELLNGRMELRQFMYTLKAPFAPFPANNLPAFFSFRDTED